MSCKYVRGFTMIELMITLLILAILAVVAFPSYQESVLKTRRTEGRAALMKAMQQQERYYSLHTTYLAFSSMSTDLNEKRFNWFSGENAQASFYEISAQSCKDKTLRECVLLKAEPGTSKVNAKYRDPKCGKLTLASSGEKTAEADGCW
ncbi:type IV pilin protein [Herminiimonas fonticola]|uniref:Type IV pilus assembly protein PilE n=1 Tax=Herminiimonas fonticola TaxID=303380 RepID=A0A4V3BV57_9BURK|nr:type IV pilin protein [Herminiimonas fonticola]RBA23938.1 prepilin-type N-terminal cleavage/methylation domain [Herminiimonas fonticola]TDN89938.1 type IV pilus assembly protein PilE [Herminiimonas fonticola]